MITDRLTARVLGLLLLVLTVVIDASYFIFARPELRGSARYAAMVVVPSLPFFVAGVLLLRRAARMKEGDGDS